MWGKIIFESSPAQYLSSKAPACTCTSLMAGLNRSSSSMEPRGENDPVISWARAAFWQDTHRCINCCCRKHKAPVPTDIQQQETEHLTSVSPLGLSISVWWWTAATVLSAPQVSHLREPRDLRCSSRSPTPPGFTTQRTATRTADNYVWLWEAGTVLAAMTPKTPPFLQGLKQDA